jgi:hypothetical protein
MKINGKTQTVILFRVYDGARTRLTDGEFKALIGSAKDTLKKRAKPD